MRLLTLNLANPENEGRDHFERSAFVDFKVSKFADGQQSLTLTGDMRGNLSYLQGADVIIKSRLNNFKDLELIICANQALRECSVATVSLYVPYFLGARSDRKFTEGSSNYLKTVICPIINSQKFESVQVLDPHSDVLEACLNNFQKVSNYLLVKYALTDIDNTNQARERIVLVSPDAGALRKIYKVAEWFDLNEVVTAVKHRDPKTSKITHTDISLKPLVHEYGKKFVIVDDICDSAGTSIELAKAIKERTQDSKIYLIATHGIFSSGLFDLSAYFEKIYCTNSVQDIKADEYSDYTVSADFVKQFNLF
jgi:ribose-phosphate pyrophosphokinase